VHPARNIELQSTTPSYPKAPRGVTLGVQSDSKHRQLTREVGGVSLTQASSMVVTSQCKIALRPGSVFCFRTISSVADEKGIMHRIADPPKKKLSLEIPRKAGTRQRTTQPPAPQAKTTSCKPKIGNLLARRTPLPTSPTKEWTQITRKKEASVPRKGTELRRIIFPAPSPSKKDRKELTITTTPFYPNILFIGGRLESSPISDDEPIVQGEEPPQREARRRRNRRRNIRRHHEAGEQDPA
jgi:hypothetical protein